MYCRFPMPHIFSFVYLPQCRFLSFLMIYTHLTYTPHPLSVAEAADTAAFPYFSLPSLCSFCRFPLPADANSSSLAFGQTPPLCFLHIDPILSPVTTRRTQITMHCLYLFSFFSIFFPSLASYFLSQNTLSISSFYLNTAIIATEQEHKVV